MEAIADNHNPYVTRLTSIEQALSAACDLSEQGDLKEAIASIEAAGNVVLTNGALSQEDTDLWVAFGKHLVSMYVFPERVGLMKQLLALYPWDTATYSDLLLCQHFIPGLSRAEIAFQHRRWAQAQTQGGGVTSIKDPNPQRPLRIGYVSPDFRRHCVSYFMEPIMNAHDREQVTVIGYGHVNPDLRDNVTQRVAGQCDVYRDIWGLDAQEVAKLIKQDGIDILVDLAGHTHDHRLDVFQQCSAPVQVTYLGYPNSTGLSCMDYRLTDSVLDQEGSEVHYAEELVSLDRCFAGAVCPEGAPAVSPPPCLKHGFVTFGCFAGAAKHNPLLLDLWSEILKLNPNAKLRLCFQGAEDIKIRQRCERALNRRGVEVSRLLFDPWRLTGEHLAAYAQVDMFLDTFPWNSHTNLCEALWMGVPAITLSGKHAVSRLSRSVLNALGLEYFACDHPEDYVKRASALAANQDALGQLRAGMRERLNGSVLSDSQHLARTLETAYRNMWRSYLEMSQA